MNKDKEVDVYLWMKLGNVYFTYCFYFIFDLFFVVGKTFGIYLFQNSLETTYPIHRLDNSHKRPQRPLQRRSLVRRSKGSKSPFGRLLRKCRTLLGGVCFGSWFLCSGKINFRFKKFVRVRLEPKECRRLGKGNLRNRKVEEMLADRKLGFWWRLIFQTSFLFSEAPKNCKVASFYSAYLIVWDK